MPFLDKKLYLLIFSTGLQIAAACLSIQTSHLYTGLNYSEWKSRVTEPEYIEREVWFFVGVSMGGLFSVIIFLTCFQGKQYLLLVALNSLYILMNASMYVLVKLSESYGDDKGFFNQLVYSESNV